MRYDRARGSLDRHATYIVGRARPSCSDAQNGHECGGAGARMPIIERRILGS
jgi:hypothetical protein